MTARASYIVLLRGPPVILGKHREVFSPTSYVYNIGQLYKLYHYERCVRPYARLEHATCVCMYARVGSSVCRSLLAEWSSTCVYVWSLETSAHHVARVVCLCVCEYALCLARI